MIRKTYFIGFLAVFFSLQVSAQQLETVKDSALAFFELEDDRDIEGLRELIRADYIQHLPGASDYRDPLLEGFQRWKDTGTGPGPHLIIRVLAEGNEAWIFAAMQRGGAWLSRVDMFAVDPTGKLSEHWEISQMVGLESRINPNDPFGLGRGANPEEHNPRISQNLSSAQLDSNKEIVRRFIHAYQATNLETLRTLVAEDLIQHDEALEDGRAALLNQAAQDARSSDSRQDRMEIVRMLAERDFVMAFIRDRNGREAQLRQVRIENGRIAEHWGIYQQVPTQRAHENDFFGYGRGPAVDFSR